MLMDFSGPACTLSEALAVAAVYLRNSGTESYVRGGWLELDDAQGWSLHLAFGSRPGT